MTTIKNLNSSTVLYGILYFILVWYLPMFKNWWVIIHITLKIEEMLYYISNLNDLVWCKTLWSCMIYYICFGVWISLILPASWFIKVMFYNLFCRLSDHRSRSIVNAIISTVVPAAFSTITSFSKLIWRSSTSPDKKKHKESPQPFARGWHFVFTNIIECRTLGFFWYLFLNTKVNMY